MIKTVDLQKIFKTEEVQTWALNNVNIEVHEGEFVQPAQGSNRFRVSEL